MTQFLKDFPEDQKRLIEDRLSATKIRELEEEAKNITGFYNRTLRAMGDQEKTPKYKRVPSPGAAWIEVLRAAPSTNGDKITPEPTFSHKNVAETVAYFGGWKVMWKEFRLTKQATSRNRFIMAYKDISNPQ